MTNSSFRDGTIKIGISKHDPSSHRASELYTTGVPEPFKVEYYAFVENYERLEQIVHSSLSDKRPNKNREFFNCSVPEAIVVIRNYGTIKYEEVKYKSPQQIRKEQFQADTRKRKENEKREKEQEERRIIRENEERERNERLQQEAIKRQEKEAAFKETGKSALWVIFIGLPMILGMTIGSLWVLSLILKMFRI